MKKGTKRDSSSKTTTIQVHADLKDKLDLLKILTSKDDLNAVISELTEFYVARSDISVDKKIEKFLRRLRK